MGRRQFLDSLKFAANTIMKRGINFEHGRNESIDDGLLSTSVPGRAYNRGGSPQTFEDAEEGSVSFLIVDGSGFATSVGESPWV